MLGGQSWPQPPFRRPPSTVELVPSRLVSRLRARLPALLWSLSVPPEVRQ
jgi:hypothetical protein